jgi:hypothetical protein
MGVTQTELMLELQKALQHGEHGPVTEDSKARTVLELVDELEVPAQSIRLHLKKMIQSGKVEVVTAMKTSMTGVVSRRKCYKMIEDEES